MAVIQNQRDPEANGKSDGKKRNGADFGIIGRRAERDRILKAGVALNYVCTNCYVLGKPCKFDLDEAGPRKAEDDCAWCFSESYACTGKMLIAAMRAGDKDVHPAQAPRKPEKSPCGLPGGWNCSLSKQSGRRPFFLFTTSDGVTKTTWTLPDETNLVQWSKMCKAIGVPEAWSPSEEEVQAYTAAAEREAESARLAAAAKAAAAAAKDAVNGKASSHEIKDQTSDTGMDGLFSEDEEVVQNGGPAPLAAQADTPGKAEQPQPRDDFSEKAKPSKPIERKTMARRNSNAQDNAPSANFEPASIPAAKLPHVPKRSISDTTSRIANAPGRMTGDKPMEKEPDFFMFGRTRMNGVPKLQKSPIQCRFCNMKLGTNIRAADNHERYNCVRNPHHHHNRAIREKICARFAPNLHGAALMAQNMQDGDLVQDGVRQRTPIPGRASPNNLSEINKVAHHKWDDAKASEQTWDVVQTDEGFTVDKPLRGPSFKSEAPSRPRGANTLERDRPDSRFAKRNSRPQIPPGMARSRSRSPRPLDRGWDGGRERSASPRGRRRSPARQPLAASPRWAQSPTRNDDDRDWRLGRQFSLSPPSTGLSARRVEHLSPPPFRRASRSPSPYSRRPPARRFSRSPPRRPAPRYVSSPGRASPRRPSSRRLSRSPSPYSKRVRLTRIHSRSRSRSPPALRDPSPRQPPSRAVGRSGSRSPRRMISMSDNGRSASLRPRSPARDQFDRPAPSSVVTQNKGSDPRLARPVPIKTSSNAMPVSEHAAPREREMMTPVSLDAISTPQNITAHVVPPHTTRTPNTERGLSLKTLVTMLQRGQSPTAVDLYISRRLPAALKPSDQQEKGPNSPLRLLPALLDYFSAQTHLEWTEAAAKESQTVLELYVRSMADGRDVLDFLLSMEDETDAELVDRYFALMDDSI